MIACFDIGGSFIKYGAPDASGRVQELGRVATPGNDFDAFVSALKSAISTMPGRVEMASLSIAGFIDAHTPKAVIANIPCVNGRFLRADLTSRLGLQVVITNDADCFALAEARYGVGRGMRNVFGIIIGSGLGGGLVIEGRLVRGAGGISGEWGHAPIADPLAGGLLTTPLPRFACGCGRESCLDTIGGARGLERVHAALTGAEATSSTILNLWRDGDPDAERTVSVFVENIARGLNLIVNTIGLDSVPVGGGLATAPDLIARLDRRVRDLALADYATPLVVPGLCAVDGGLTGAAIAGTDQFEPLGEPA